MRIKIICPKGHLVASEDLWIDLQTKSFRTYCFNCMNFISIKFNNPNDEIPTIPLKKKDETSP